MFELINFNLFFHKNWRHDTQHNDIKPNDTQHNDTQQNGLIHAFSINETQHTQSA